MNFWDSSVWGFLSVISVLLISILLANALEKNVPIIQRSLIPTSVLGGAILIVFTVIYKLITGTRFFDTALFNNAGFDYLEMLTYHSLALGFIASALKSSKGKLSKKRSAEILNTGLTTVSTYLLQGILGMLTVTVCAFAVKELISASGLLLAFGFGQGSGQAMNYGNIYETDHGFVDGKSFGLSVAALGFICAALGGVIHLHIMKHKGKLSENRHGNQHLSDDDIQAPNEIPMQESIDKLTVQIALIVISYLIAYVFMFLLGNAFEGLKSVVYGFNFLFGVLAATGVKLVKNFLLKHNIAKKEYTNDFLLTRTSNFFYDLMIVAGVAAIRVEAIERYWWVLLILAVVGFVSTFVYNRIIANVLFPTYKEEQFMVMYGMLTGTASTGVVLLREIDGEFRTPAAENIVYQNFPAIILGFPLMFIATLAPEHPWISLAILGGMFVALNIALFRSKIFKRRKRGGAENTESDG